MEKGASLPVDYVCKYSDEELMVLNNAVSVPSSLEPSTSVHETQQALHEFSPSPEQKRYINIPSQGSFLQNKT